MRRGGETREGEGLIRLNKPMFLYCPNCQNLIEKTQEGRREGDTIEKRCNRCGKIISFFVKYKAFSKILDKDGK